MQAKTMDKEAQKSMAKAEAQKKRAKQFMDKGDMESATGVDIETMKYLRTIQKQRSDFYMMRLQDYLIIGKGQGKFPAYLSQNTMDGMLPDKSDKYNSPIYLNHTSRYGYSLAQSMRNLDVYSDRAHYDPPCTDCGY